MRTSACPRRSARRPVRALRLTTAWGRATSFLLIAGLVAAPPATAAAATSWSAAVPLDSGSASQSDIDRLAADGAGAVTFLGSGGGSTSGSGYNAGRLVRAQTFTAGGWGPATTSAAAATPPTRLRWISR